MGAETTQVIAILDVDDVVQDGELLPNVPAATYLREVVRLSEFGPPPVIREGALKGPIDWIGLAHSVSRMAGALRRSKELRSHPTEFVIAGRAPLPLFLQLGLSLSAWAGPSTLVNRRKDGQWDVLALEPFPIADSKAFFDAVTFPSAVSDATGIVAVYVSCAFGADREVLHDFIRNRGNHAAGIVEIATSEAQYLDAPVASKASNELVEHLAKVAEMFPRRTGMAVFVAGPATLAYLVGRAINPKVHTNVQVSCFDPPRYGYCFTLPLGERSSRVLPGDEDAVEGRKRCLSSVTNAIGALQRDLREVDLPHALPSDIGSAFIETLRALKVESEPTTEFRLSVLRGRLLIGESILEAMRGESEESIRRVASLLVLHELYHVTQGIESTNFHEIGRTGIALEEIDFFADAVAVETLLRFWARGQNSPSPTELGGEAEALVRSVITGIRAFDRIENVKAIEQLSERRLRRYLIWALEQARSSLIGSLDDAAVLFGSRLIAELGPVDGALDARFEKVVTEVSAETQFAVALDRRIRRMARRPNFEPAEILRAVREFDEKPLSDAMEVVVNEWRDLLVSWRGRS